MRIAVPNKGSLAEHAARVLLEAGYAGRRDNKELVVRDEANGVEVFYLRPRDIAIYVGSGQVDAGITGRDLLLDSGSSAREVMELGFGASTFRYAAPAGRFCDASELAGARVATSYTGLVAADLQQRGVDAGVVRLDGAVETAITLGVADAIADVVQTGATLRSQGLEVFGEPILHSEAVLIAQHFDEEPAAMTVLRGRLAGVITARQYVLIDYDVPAHLVEQACAVTPGLESPTVSPLRDKDWCAVRAMVKRHDTNRVMDELYAVGARAILVTPISACRL